MQTLTADTLRTPDGTALHLHHWPHDAPRGTVQLVHGLGEHLGRYAWLAGQLHAAGWRVVGHDHRGHGRSGGARGALPDAQALCADLALVVDAFRRSSPPGRPHVLLGHSMGGMVAGRFVAEALADRPAPWSRPVDGLVLSSPALDAGLGPWQRLQLALGHALAPDLALGNGLQPGWVSRDPAVVQAYTADPLNHDRITPRLVRSIVDGGALVRARAPLWTTHTLLLWAGADRCVDPVGSAAFAAAAPRAVCTAQVFPGLFHEVFNEPERDEVVAHLLRWLARF
ncbi:lysophospholipase [Rubrivivax sp. RP6-9]|uniref:alpha/beta hydrolase n=1 Tax=Rubrivivax sp. RP6-9 TaxID=3415750 RepID=UPI003CC59682